jgi:hypothetical protein
LVRAKNTSTGDKPWWVNLWREKRPVLLVGIAVGGWGNRGVATLLDKDGVRRLCELRRLEAVSTR